MLKALLPAIMKLFAYLLVLHLSIDGLLLPPQREYSASRLEGTRECSLCASSVRICSKNLLQIVSLRMSDMNWHELSAKMSDMNWGQKIFRTATS
jgi:hypothetical protein